MAMVRKNPDSMVVKLWMKNIWVRQASKAMSWAPSQNRQSMRGRVDVERTRSVTDSMHKKRNIGSWRLRSALTTARVVIFPTTATTYMEQKGIPIQTCRCSSPGMPISEKATGEGWEVLRGGMMFFSLIFISSSEDKVAMPIWPQPEAENMGDLVEEDP